MLARRLARSGFARSAVARYALAVAASAAALVVNVLLGPLVYPNVFPPFVAAVMVSASYGGLGPGLLATGLTAVANLLFLFPVREAAGLGVAVREGLYVVSALLVVAVGAALRRARQRAEDERQETARQTESLARSEARFRGLLDLAPDAIVIADRAGRIVLANTQAQALFGYAPDELVGQPVEALLPDDLRARHVGHRQSFHAAPRTRPMGAGLDLAARRKDGTQVPVEISLSPMATPDGILVMSAIRDVTERKKVDAHIRALNEDLERRLTELAAVNRELEAFSYSVSHDLRAPLRGIDGFSQALLEEYGEILDDQGKGYLRRVRQATVRMGELIDDLLNLSRVTRREMRRETVDLSAIARSVMAQLRRAEPGRHVEFIHRDGLTVLGDSHLLRLMLENLLGNAWKFTGKEPHARIQFGVVDHEGRSAYFVRDNGVGFDMAYAHKLFGAFQRLHGMSEFSGTGIGLATVQRIINRHGGRVWAEAEVGKGATFYFTL
jgi:PAS domain S-box-containing protein